ncbi:YceI family protein [Flavobacterium sp. JP2137]|uniref:YceI family protein n=1 Tax=Flavobacterium sp. JP2137 TaxID=3414510 RepID=UPI003D2FEE08
MKKLIYVFVAVFASATMFAQTTWKVDQMHSFLTFSVKHLGISFVEGKFDQYEGSFTASKADLTDGKFDFSIQSKSINTGVSMRDDHLRTNDFFNAEKYPTITFTSTSLKKVADNKYVLDGTLTIRGIAKPVKFDLVYGGLLKDDGQGNQKMGFQATTTINRFDFDVAYDPTGQTIAKEVSLKVNLEFTK